MATQRLFIAFELPEDAIAQIVQWMQQNIPQGVYPEPATNLHQTLAFLGDTDEQLIQPIQQILASLNPGGVTISGATEYRELDKLAMLVFQDQGGQEVFQALNAQLNNLTGYTPQFDPWLSHCTVWRYAPENKPNLQPPLPHIEFTPARISIMRSEKLPQGGAQYVRVARKKLTIRVIDDILQGYEHEEEGYTKEEASHQGSDQHPGKEAYEPASQATRHVAAPEWANDLWWPSGEDGTNIWYAVVPPHEHSPIEMSDAPGVWQGQVGNVQMGLHYGAYENPFDLAAAIINKVQRLQAAPTANKRTGSFMGLMFLEKNGYDTSGISDNPQALEEFVRIVNGLSDADDYRTEESELAQFLAQHVKYVGVEPEESPEQNWWEGLNYGEPGQLPTPKQSNLFDDDGMGRAFWYDPASGQVHWGETHYMIFHKMFGQEDYENQYRERDKEHGIFGWVFPMADEDDPEHEGYAIDFATDFGYNTNKNNLKRLVDEATEAVEYSIGYAADEVTMGYPEFAQQQRSAGHAFESDDLDNITDSNFSFPNREYTCQNCGSQIHDQICGDCGTENMQWWTEGRGLQNFVGSVKQAITYQGINFSCFAFLPPMLYLGNRHHMAIMQQLLQHGYTWESLMAAKQLWGWSSDEDSTTVGLYLQTDAAVLDKSLLPQLEMAFTKLTGKTNFVLKSDQEPTNEEYAPDWDSHYGDEGFYSDVPPVMAYNAETGAIEHWGSTDVGFENKGAAWQEDKEFEKLILLDNAWTVRYNNKTSSTWEEQFESPVEENLEDFAQEEGQLTEEQKAAQGVSGPFNINGWTVYERDCNDVYPTHDAIWIDRTNNIILIGYQGHHHDIGANSPFMQSIIGGMDPYNQTAGHFRTEPSKTEPHPAGFLWHGDDATKDEKNVIKQVLKQHYNVDKLKSLYKEIPDAYSEDNDYYEDEEPY